MVVPLHLYQAINKKETFFQNCLTKCRVVKQADTPPCLGGGE